MKKIAGFLILFNILVMSCEKQDKTVTPRVIQTKSDIEMVLIPAGWFEMGSRDKTGESPVHRVWIDAFLMDRYEVTQEQYGKLVLGNPSHFKGPNNPMEQMRWSDAALYCNARSRDEGLKPCYNEETGECDFQANGYRLPTEAEWEYACRAGSKTDFFFGRDARNLKNYAWFAVNSLERTNPVGRKKPNPWGLYDMYGNVAEWCNDRYDENYYKNSPEKNPRGPTEGKKYVLRGGAWSSSVESCRSAYRVGEDPGFQDACFARDNVGFRCVRKGEQDVNVSKVTTPVISVSYKIPQPVWHRQAGSHVLRFASNQSRIYGAVYLELPLTSSIQHQVSGIEYPASSIQHPASSTGFIYHEIYLQHKTGASHPEKPQRLEAIVARIKKLASERADLTVRFITPDLSSDCSGWIAAIHTPQYMTRVSKSCQEGIEYLDSADTPVSPESYKVAVAAVAGVLTAIDKVMAGEISNAFCAVRPPGHHALKDRAMGFCIFNNVAIGARYIQKKYGLSKVLIVDWDVHHGNGTQAAFYDDPTVLYFSTHQFPFYPGTGSEEEIGTGKGTGYTINVPMQAGSGDDECIKAFEEKLRPAAMEFDPDFVLISAGFDAYKDDPLGGMNVTTEGYAKMTAIVKEIAEKCCKGRIVSVLEGGYNLAGLAESVYAHVSALLN